MKKETLIFDSIEEMKKYFDGERHGYFFSKNECESFYDCDLIDIEINFDLDIDCDLIAGNVKARNITTTRGINCLNLAAENISARDIIADGGYIDAGRITAQYLQGRNIEAYNINASNIFFYAICFAYSDIACETIRGSRNNAKYFSLDGDVIVGGKKQ